eukprot:scaffold50460_cov79-Cyclotella_meneghiniana.AAC.5
MKNPNRTYPFVCKNSSSNLLFTVQRRLELSSLRMAYLYATQNNLEKRNARAGKSVLPTLLKSDANRMPLNINNSQPPLKR